jgi:hypothetical protein
MYTKINDAARRYNLRGMIVGQTEIWYMKNINPLVKYTIKDLNETHILLGEIFEKDLEIIYDLMQGENWSPCGEAVELISHKGLQHTSMSVGDIVKVDGKYFVCESVDWRELTE